MTSLAFIFGVLPMATSTGAGSGSQHAVGTGVMGGMIPPPCWRSFRAAVLCAGASPFSAKGASAINRRASAARRNNRKRRPRWSPSLCVQNPSALIYFALFPCSHCGNLFTKHAFNKVFPVPQFMFNHNSLSYYYGRFYITSLPMGSCAPLLL